MAYWGLVVVFRVIMLAVDDGTIRRIRSKHANFKEKSCINEGGKVSDMIFANSKAENECPRTPQMANRSSLSATVPLGIEEGLGLQGFSVAGFSG